MSKYNHNYYIKNKGKIKENRNKNREKYNETQRKWRKKNIEKERERCRKKYYKSKGISEIPNYKGQIWNKGLTKETDERVLKTSQTLSKKLKGKKGKPHNEITKEKLSIIAKERKLGGYIKGSGRGKKGWYKGIFCDSSWELAYVIYCIDNNIPIKRNTVHRHYIWNNKQENYIPDFIVNNDIVEIKGYKSDRWLAKLKYNPDIKVLYKNELNKIFEYVINKYGKNYTNLYENV